jgi:hypothetical protein
MKISVFVRFATNTQTSNFMEILQWEPSCSMRTDGRKDMTKLIMAFRNFANAPKNSSYLQFYFCHVARKLAKKLEAQTKVCVKI